MKSKWGQLVSYLFVGAGLAVMTVLIMNYLKSNSGVANGWAIFAPSVDIGYTATLLAILIVDAVWALSFLIWIIKRILRVKDEDRTLRLP